MPLKVLIIGAGVCGPALATLLRRADPSASTYDITVVERAAKLRDTGLQIDLRAHGIPIVRKMGCEFSIPVFYTPFFFLFFLGGGTLAGEPLPLRFDIYMRIKA